MSRFRRSLCNRQPRHTPVFQLVTGQSLNAAYLFLQVEPAIRHGLKELETTNPRHAMTELALMAYLMGMGFDYRTARTIVESWETDENLLAQGILTETE